VSDHSPKFEKVLFWKKRLPDVIPKLEIELYPCCQVKRKDGDVNVIYTESSNVIPNWDTSNLMFIENENIYFLCEKVEPTPKQGLVDIFSSPFFLAPPHLKKTGKVTPIAFPLTFQ
jgi:hypothetical protein